MATHLNCSNMTTDPERAANTSGTESVEDEDDNHRKILRSTVLAALRDGIGTAPGLEVLQYYFPSSFGKLYIHTYTSNLYKLILINARRAYFAMILRKIFF